MKDVPKMQFFVRIMLNLAFMTLIAYLTYLKSLIQQKKMFRVKNIPSSKVLLW